MHLTDRIRLLPQADQEEQPEDIFAHSLGLIFSDDLHNQHGEIGAHVIYQSPQFGDIELTLADPTGESERLLFSHYLWNASVQLAEFVGADAGTRRKWDVEGQKVLELGAGTGLAGITCSLAGAEEVTISDYPAPNILKNITENVRRSVCESKSNVSVQGHQWGELGDAFSASCEGYYTRIIAADCLWMPWQHENLASSMAHFLSRDPDARVWVVAGFHTGRAKMAPFFNIINEHGLEMEEIYERNAVGVERPWAVERDGGREDVTERKWWLAIAILRHKRQK